MQMPAAGIRNLKRSQFDEGRYYVPDSVGQKIDAWLDGKFFLYNNEYGANSEQVLSDMNILLKAGVKLFVLDNLMSMSINGYEGDKNERQKAFILDVKSFAMKNNVHIILVAHPRKSSAFLRKNDISGSANITDAADNCWILHRTNQDFLHAITEFYDASYASRYRQYGNVLSLEKSRLWGAIDYMCGFHYDLASRRFKNTPEEDIHYGWEQEKEQTNIHFQEVERNEEKKIEDAMFGQLSQGQAPF
jgi:RecA-family ATPase